MAVLVGETETEEALQVIRDGSSVLDLTGVGINADQAKMLMNEVNSETQPVTWKVENGTHDDGGGEYCAFASQGIEGVAFSDACSEMPNVTFFKVRLNRFGRHAVIGLTTDSGDNQELPNGYGVQLFPRGLFKATGWAFEDNKFDPDKDVIGIGIKKGAVGLYRTDPLTGKDRLIETLGPTEAPGMYAKVFIKENSLTVRVLSTNTCTKVELMKLNGNAVGDQGAKCIAESIRREQSLVTLLDLGLNRIGDEGVEYLAESFAKKTCKVTTLNLSHNRLSDAGAIRLAEVFEKKSCSITSLDLTDNNIGDDGAARIAEALKKEECSIISLKLALNKIGPLAIMKLGEALQMETCKVVSINMGHNQKLTNQAKKAISGVYKKTMRLDVV